MSTKDLYTIAVIVLVISQITLGDNETYILHKKHPETAEINKKPNEVKSDVETTVSSLEKVVRAE